MSTTTSNDDSTANAGTPSTHEIPATTPSLPSVSREDLIASAVKFLRDPKVQSAPLAKRIAFLETKGLTSGEIETALFRATSTTAGANGPSLPPKDLAVQSADGHSSNNDYYAQVVQQQQMMLLQQQHQMGLQRLQQQWTWKDYALGGIGVAGLVYGVFLLSEKYIKPLINFPTASSIKTDTDKIEAQLETTSKSVDLVRVQTLDVIKAIESNADDLQKSLVGMAEVIKGLEEADEKRGSQIEQIDQEIGTLKAMIFKMTERTKDQQDEMLTDLQNELKSLKSLLLNRRIASNSGGSTQINGSGVELAGTGSGGLVGQVTAQCIQEGSMAAIETIPDVTNESGFVKNLLSSNTKPAIPAWQIEAARAAKEKRSVASNSLGNSGSSASVDA
ncbi:hypothetical protein BATDEDRAFT_85742 [Batrachochytrium dendrobatidis JAM81]|uniref:Peroxisomal membrane protein PEX14 n=1 Tax=Batrachochytrium dendrobatidis (strain JAM81 / FGSC 10211) TaxID=684364 RepID=F4NT45_BATDJ|nr:uncharacterized protein BATDEDRAFT_85742 [Batrachochytrium dendrobatidis JAM81]EGF83083.1 hypothetical protein BATDEDRAFT_85742 [Batrachochytrium dendrobatidis JAM81]|eukprot:XP_006675976.1 hypothetical protein BATDEDRAFT_85742 [Batrachochytrium dendrobatidis JAM81]